MKYNILLNSANIALDPKNPNNVLLVLEVNENAKIPEVRILAASLERFTVGFVLGELLSSLQLPSLNHIQRVPVVLDIEGNNWTLVNFLDDEKQFNVEQISNQLRAALNPTPVAEPAPSTESTTTEESNTTTT